MNVLDAFNLAAKLHQAGDADQAQLVCQQILTQELEQPAALNLLGVIAHQSGRFHDAIGFYRRAIAQQPDFPDAHYNLGTAYRALDQLDSAALAYQRAAEIAPQLHCIWTDLSGVLIRMGRFDDVISLATRAITLHPTLVEARINLGNAFCRTGQIANGIVCFEQAALLDPTGQQADSARICALHFHPDYDDAAILTQRQLWDHRHAHRFTSLAPHRNLRQRDRRLRIGYVSAYFRHHCQSLFTLPLLANHDHAPFEIFCYSDVTQPDAVTDQIRPHADVWRQTAKLTDAQLADRIAADHIDILVDLTMHMAKCRLLTFARKAAPVQVTWLAYPGTTGLAAMDYRLTDPHLDPPGQTDANYSEQSLRLPDTFWCYDPGPTPDPNPLPAEKNGHITFGCLNNYCKVNPALLRLWSRVLQSTPRSRLLLLTPAGEARNRAAHEFAASGIDPSRIDFVPHQSRENYLAEYHRIDLGLDTLPYNGHTTSLDSLWMGVPVITRVGRTVVGRAGLSQLSNLNLAELAASSDDQFVTIARQLAADLPRLAELRRNLRQRMRESPLTNGPRFAQNVESAYRQMWSAWCDPD